MGSAPVQPDRAARPRRRAGRRPGQQGRHQTDCGPFGEAGRGVLDKDISCDDPIAPDNEVAVAVHPTDPNLVLAGSNDYQLEFQGATVILQVPSGFFLSQDGGTWIDGELPLKGSLGGGDPVPGFDLKHNQMVFTSLSFVCGQFAPLCSRGNIMFASSPLDKLTGSADDQITWSDRTIANGNSSDAAAQQIFLDKEWMAVDNNPSSPHYGNIYVTFSSFRIESGAYDESPIMFVKSEDGGKNWTQPVEITGRNPRYCTFQDDPDDSADTRGPNSPQGTAEGPDDPFACDQDQFSIPVVAPNGDLIVHFHNEQHSAAYEAPQRYDSQIMVVKSTDGGATWAGEAATPANQAGCVRQQQAATGVGGSCIVPIHVIDMEDSYDTTSHGPDPTFPDYPINVSGRTTLTGHQFRVNSAGNIAVGPGPTGYRLWVTFADNCAGIRPGTAATPAVTRRRSAESHDRRELGSLGSEQLAVLPSASPGLHGLRDVHRRLQRSRRGPRRKGPQRLDGHAQRRALRRSQRERWRTRSTQASRRPGPRSGRNSVQKGRSHGPPLLRRGA